MKQLLEQIEATQKLLGWCSLAKAQALASMVVALRPSISLEIGLYAGRSFFPIALAHKFTGIGMAIGVEPWSYEAAIEGYDEKNADWWKHHSKLELAQSQLLNHIPILGLQGVVKIVQVKSDDYAAPDGIGLLHLDGQHSKQAERDVKRFAPKVLVGGLVVLDDINWSDSSNSFVTNAADWLNRHGFKELYRIFNKPDGGVDDWGLWIRTK